MSTALPIAALLLGLASGPHCVAMCGPLQVGAATRFGGAGWRALAGLQVGRGLSYTLAGALVATTAGMLLNLGSASEAWRPLWTLLQAAVIVFGLTLLWTGRVPLWLSTRLRRSTVTRAAGAVGRPVSVFRRVPGPMRTVGIGLCWAAVPCGMLQSALIVAALGSNAYTGALIMASFWTGTTLSLGLFAAVWRSGARSGMRQSRSTLPLRASGAVIAAASGYAMVVSISSRLGTALCL